MLPKEFLHELNMILARFQWGFTEDKRKIHWKHWDVLCMAKFDEGLGSNLRTRGVVIDNICKVCGVVNESVFHLFFECPFVVATWNLMVFFMLWSIQKNRNACIFYDSCSFSNGVAIQVVKLADEYASSVSNSLLVSAQSLIFWSPPSDLIIKVNVDAAWNPNTLLAVVAAMARDSNGTILYSAIRRFHGNDSALYAEFLATRMKAEMTCFQVLHDIILEIDSLMTVDEIKKGYGSTCLLGKIVFDIISLSCMLHRCDFIHVRREANTLTRNLAK